MRRIMRPSADDAGQPTAAAPEPEAPIGEPNPGANPFARPVAAEPASTEGEPVPVSATDETAALPVIGPLTAEQAAAAQTEEPAAEQTFTEPPRLRRRSLFRRRRRDPLEAELQPAPVVDAPIVVPAPGPAGLDPAEEVIPPVGRRGRLRRRLRYLRRARELMLRDLGGLVHEIHRTGGGDMASHAAVVTGKVDRIRRLDAESVALETALGAPRGETVVFQPGIGGTCVVCGELYASDAHFCSECGTSTTQTQLPLAEAEVPPPPVDPRGTLNLFGPREERPEEQSPPVEIPAEPAEDEAPTQTELPTEAATAGAAEAAPAAEGAEAEPVEDSAPAAESAEAETAGDEERPTEEADPPAADESAPQRNGTVPPTLQPGDPLSSWKERSS